MIVRWSVWGAWRLDLLQHSVATFRRLLGRPATYVVFSDRRDFAESLDRDVIVLPYTAYDGPEFGVFEGPTWAKWCPRARLAPDEVEIHVDSDVFLLAKPTELLKLIDSTDDWDFAILGEGAGASWQRGCFVDRIPASMPYVNAGFFVQNARHDITRNLRETFSWWSTHRDAANAEFHDEQGALTLALVPSHAQNRLRVLPVDRYRIVSPRTNPELRSVDNTVLLHATHPEHPAFDRFYAEIHDAGYGRADRS
jgi:hypothetical protein